MPTGKQCTNSIFPDLEDGQIGLDDSLNSGAASAANPSDQPFGGC